MTMHGDFSPEAQAAARRKEQAAAVLADEADAIVAALGVVAEGHVVVAVVHGGQAFGGTHLVAQDDLVTRVPEIEGEHGVAMVFTGEPDHDAVRRRAADMAEIARKRREVIERILARRTQPD
jgi:hypothetical protein